MKKVLLLLFCFFGLTTLMDAQVYLDEFDNDDPAFMGGAAAYTYSEANGELTITGDGSAGQFDVITYQPHDATAGTGLTVDATGTNKVFIRAKASNIGTQLRLDLQDSGNFATTQPSLTKTLTTDFMVLEYDFTGGYVDAGYGGTGCAAGTGPCPVDGTDIVNMLFFVNPGTGGFGGTIVIDYISFGEEPNTVIMSDVFQDHFDVDSSINNILQVPSGFTQVLDVANSEIVWTGDGSSVMWEPFAYNIRNPVTYDEIDIDVSGNNKLFVRAKSTVPGTVLRFDLLDIDGFATTQGSIGKILTDEYVTHEYDFSGTFNDLGYGGTPCTAATAPCPVDPTRIRTMTIFVDPGGMDFLGEVSIDYISFGNQLEPPAPPGALEYGDHFNNNTTDFVADPGGFVSSETGSEWTITGDGTGAPYTAISYSPNEAGAPITVDASGNNKVFIRAKSTVDVPLRVDLIDAEGYITSQPALTKVLSGDYNVFEYDFSGAYFDGGYGGTPCTAGPCAVDGSQITTVLIYPNPVDGGFNGEITIDFLSFGAPMGVDMGPIGAPNYQDHYENNDLTFITDLAGITSSIDNSIWTMTGDGSSGMWTPIEYALHDLTNGQPELGSVIGSGDKIYIKAKASTAGTELRIDLVDNEGYWTSEPATVRTLSDDWTIIEYDFANTYTDGGYGGTACTTGPCPVDGERISALQFYIDPGTGMFNGSVDIDWVKFGSPIVDLGPVGIPNYSDDYTSDDLTSITDITGLVSTISNGEWSITGDGSSAQYGPVSYAAHDLTTNDSLAVDAIGSNNVMYIRAKSTNDGTELRIDLQDSQGYVTSNPSVQNNLTTDYQVLTYDYTSTYTDGGFGGTPCMAGPCPVDGFRITDLQFFIDPGVGEYNGTLTIDWISFGMPLDVAIDEIPQLELLQVYPNPATDELGVRMELTETSDVTIRIYDMLGRVVLNQNTISLPAGDNFEKLNISSLNSGTYFLQINVNGLNTSATKVVKD